MNTKGTSATGLVINMIIGLSLIAVVFAIFFAKGSLFMGLRSIIPNPIDYIPIGTSSGDFGDSIGKRDAVSVYDEFALAYQSLANVDQDECFFFMPQDQFKYLFDEHTLTLMKDGHDMRIYLDNTLGSVRNEKDATIGSVSGSILIKNASPCYIYGGVAERFYDLWLDNPANGEPGLFTQDAREIEIHPKYKTYVNGIEQLPIKTDGETFVLYKNHDNICLFATAAWKGNKCKVRNEGVKMALDNDCFNERKSYSLQQMAKDYGYPIYYQGQCSTWP